MELEEIIKGCKNGERQAQDLLYKKYSQQMMRTCYRFVQNKQVAQDLMHDGFILIFVSINHLQQIDRLESWMTRIMTNLALKYVNQNRLIPFILISDLPKDEEPADEEPLLELIPLEVLLKMVDRLPEGYRKVFKLSVLDGLSHKEIAKILHIAPHSSSSQFYRAKEHLKKMIAQYQLQLILLLFLLLPSIGYLFFWKDNSEMFFNRKSVSVNTLIRDSLETENGSIAYTKHSIGQKNIKKINSLSLDTIVVHSDEDGKDTAKMLSVINKTSVVAKKKASDAPMKNIVYRSIDRSKWALSFEYNGGRQVTDLSPRYFKTPTTGDISSVAIPSFVGNWNDYYHYLQEHGHTMADQKEVQSLIDIAQKNKGKIVERELHYRPFTIGVVLFKSLDEHWGMETGLNYTRLISDFQTGVDAFICERQELHYIGIPLRSSYTIKRFKRFSIYSSVGVTLEIPVVATLKSEYIVAGNLRYSKYNTLNPPLQWSVDGGVGFQYIVIPSISLFVEPKLRYYFDDGSEIKTIRKEHPFSLSLPIGIRFSY